MGTRELGERAGVAPERSLDKYLTKTPPLMVSSIYIRLLYICERLVKYLVSERDLFMSRYKPGST